jgi:hypothetical protein
MAHFKIAPTAIRKRLAPIVMVSWSHLRFAVADSAYTYADSVAVLAAVTYPGSDPFSQLSRCANVGSRRPVRRK